MKWAINEVERLEQDLKDTKSEQQREYITMKLKEIYALLKSNEQNMSQMQNR